MAKHRHRYEFTPRPLHQVIFGIRNRLSFRAYLARRDTPRFQSEKL